MDAPKPRRFQFGLRALMLAFVPVAIVALPLGYYVRRPAPPQLVPASGTVMLDGEPIGGARVQFISTPPHGHKVVGFTATTGELSLRTVSLHCKAGVVPRGSYKVAVVGTTAVIPRRYANVATSGLTAEVTADGPNVFTFNLVTE
jgi:hypothetical protein